MEDEVPGTLNLGKDSAHRAPAREAGGIHFIGSLSG